MEPKVKPDQHPFKHQGDEQDEPAKKTTGTPPPPQSNPDHSVPDLQARPAEADDKSSIEHDEGDVRSGMAESPRATVEDAPGMNEQQQG